MIDKLENKKCDLTTEHTIYMIFLYKMENFMIHAVVLYEQSIIFMTLHFFQWFFLYIYRDL